MNESENIALKYLENKYPNYIIEKLQNPDFRVKNNNNEILYEVKRIYKESIILTSKQLKTFDIEEEIKGDKK